MRPKQSDMRYQWLVVRLEAIDTNELRELVFDAWRMVVPKKLAALSDDELKQVAVAQRAGAAESVEAPIGAARVACGGQLSSDFPAHSGMRVSCPYLGC